MEFLYGAHFMLCVRRAVCMFFFRYFFYFGSFYMIIKRVKMMYVSYLFTFQLCK